MKTLLLVRHAIAQDRDEAAAQGIADPQRPLTDKGAAKMHRISRALHQLLPAPTRLLCSPTLRTRQTAAILSEQWSCATIASDTLAPGGDAMALLDQLNEDPGPIVLVGHEPDLSELMGLLLCARQIGFIRIKKGGAALLELEEPLAPGKAELQWLLSPKQLLALADRP
jgi:phosphohistidine phosphatase